jgi:uncharacterized protein (UPF0303 family)
MQPGDTVVVIKEIPYNNGTSLVIGQRVVLVSINVSANTAVVRANNRDYLIGPQYLLDVAKYVALGAQVAAKIPPPIWGIASDTEINAALKIVPDPECKCTMRDLMSGNHPSNCEWLKWKKNGQR